MPVQRALAIGVMVVGTFLVLVAATRYVQRPHPAAASTAASVVEARPMGSGETLKFFKNPSKVALPAMTDLDGRTIAQADLAGKVVLVNFWATWCGPCREEVPELIALKEKYRGKLLIIGISQDSEPPATVKAFAQARGMNYPVVMDTDALDNLFPGVSALPTTFLVDREGRVVKKHVGMLSANM